MNEMGGYERLRADVVDRKLCTFCGACISACLLRHLEWAGEPLRTERKAACEDCLICYEACPVRGEIGDDEVFGEKRRDRFLGVYRRIVAARSEDEEVVRNAQDGGVVSTILKHLMKSYVDGAIVVRKQDDWAPLPSVAKDVDDVLAAGKTKFGISPNLMLIRDAVLDDYLDRICVVGMPCHVRGVRHLQRMKFELAPAIKFVIGLFCRENYEYDALRRYVESIMHDISAVRKFSVVEDAMLVHFDDETLSIPITEVKKWVPRHCLLCEDFASELADISVGCDGSPEGFSTVIIRTEHGERVFTEIEEEGLLKTASADLSTIRDIAKRKKEKAEQTSKIYALRDENKSVEEIAEQLGIEQSTVIHRLEKY